MATYMFDEKMKMEDFIDYAFSNGSVEAANLLLLCGPNGYAGSVDEYYSLLAILNGRKEKQG